MNRLLTSNREDAAMAWGGGKKPTQRPDWKIILYTRQGCHLCDDAWRLLQSYQARHGFSLDKADIDADPELRERFDQCVPVVEINGKVRFRGKVNPVLFERLMEAKQQVRNSNERRD